MLNNMNSKRLLFFPQNETHLENMIPLLPKLESEGFICEFIDASKMYHQNIYNTNQQLKLIQLNTTCKKPFYTSSTMQKIKYVITLKKELKNINHKYEGLFFGNDGALQRLVMKKLSVKRTFFLVDAIINDNTFSFFKIFSHSGFISYDVKDWLRRKIKLVSMRVIRYLPFNYFLCLGNFVPGLPTYKPKKAAPAPTIVDMYIACELVGSGNVINQVTDL